MPTFTGTDGDDRFVPTAAEYDQSWTYRTLGGNDVVLNGPRPDDIDTGDGDDTVNALGDLEFFDVVLSGTFPNFRYIELPPPSSDDLIVMGEGNDTWIAGAGKDRVSGGPGFDIAFFSTNPVAGTVFGNLGPNVRRIDGGHGSVTIDMAAGTAVYSGQNVTLTTPDGDFIRPTLGSYNHRFSGFEGASVTAGTRLFGDDAPLEAYRIGTGGEVTTEIDGRGGLDIVGFVSTSQSITANLGNGMASENLAAGKIHSIKLTGIEGIGGSTRADRLTGSNGDDIFIGSAGADTIDALGGIDSLYYDEAAVLGRTGLYPSVSGVTVNLGTGITTVAGAAGTVKGIENVTGSPGMDTITGDDRDNVLAGQAGNDILLGGRGNDRMDGGAGDDSLNGGADDDRLAGGDGIDSLDGGDGVDTLDFSLESGTLGAKAQLKKGTVLDTFGNSDTVSNIENLFGSARRDILKGDDGVNRIEGDGDNDTLGGLGGDDILIGGDGNDTVFGGAGRDWIIGGDGKDTIFGEEGGDDIEGGSGRDKLRDNKIEGSLTDFMDRYVGAFINGKTLPDTTPVGGNILQGQGGADLLVGIGRLEGGEGNDKLTGLGVLLGGSGNDRLEEDKSLVSDPVGISAILVGGAGKDTLIGGWVSYNYATSGVAADIEAGTARVSLKDRDTLSDTRWIQGTAFDDKLTGASGRFTQVFGDGGNDVLSVNDIAGGKTFTAWGGAGNDRFTATGEGSVRLIGGGGKDTFLVAVKDDIVIEAGDKADKVTVFGGDLAINPSRTVYGGAGNDKLEVRKTGSVEIRGGSGNDTMTLKSAFNIDVYGSGGTDTFVLRGTTGNVRIHDYDPAREILDLRGALPDKIKSFADMIDDSSELAQGLAIGLDNISGLLLIGIEKSELQDSLILI